MIRQALILAAGRGERLRPLTDQIPKALIEVGGRPLIAWHLHKLAAAGIREVVINTQHLAEQLHDRLGDGSAYALRIRFSDEQPRALETLGGIVHALPLLRPEPFLLINADVYSTLDYATLSACELTATAPQAHLLLIDNPPHHARGDFSMRDGLLQPPAQWPTYTYSGLAAIHPAMVAGINDDGQPRPLAPLLLAKAGQGKISTGMLAGCWHDIGTPQRLRQCREFAQTGDE